jgi:hypothetical protein
MAVVIREQDCCGEAVGEAGLDSRGSAMGTRARLVGRDAERS